MFSFTSIVTFTCTRASTLIRNYLCFALPPSACPASSCLCTHFSAPSRTFHDDASNILFLAARFSSPQRLFHRRNGKSSDASFFCAFDDEPLAVAASLLHGSSASISNFVNESKCFFFFVSSHETFLTPPLLHAGCVRSLVYCAKEGLRLIFHPNSFTFLGVLAFSAGRMFEGFERHGIVVKWKRNFIISKQS